MTIRHCSAPHLSRLAAFLDVLATGHLRDLYSQCRRGSSKDLKRRSRFDRAQGIREILEAMVRDPSLKLLLRGPGKPGRLEVKANQTVFIGDLHRQALAVDVEKTGGCEHRVVRMKKNNILYSLLLGVDCWEPGEPQILPGPLLGPCAGVIEWENLEIPDGAMVIVDVPRVRISGLLRMGANARLYGTSFCGFTVTADIFNGPPQDRADAIVSHLIPSIPIALRSQFQARGPGEWDVPDTVRDAIIAIKNGRPHNELPFLEPRMGARGNDGTCMFANQTVAGNGESFESPGIIRGQDGRNGRNGLGGGTLTVEVAYESTGRLRLDADGGDGGAGQDGQNGESFFGGNGGNLPLECFPGSPGRGGDVAGGGSGGLGGLGGDGGWGGRIALSFTPTTDLVNRFFVSASVKGGNGGPGGLRGRRGISVAGRGGAYTVGGFEVFAPGNLDGSAPAFQFESDMRSGQGSHGRNGEITVNGEHRVLPNWGTEEEDYLWRET